MMALNINLSIDQEALNRMNAAMAEIGEKIQRAINDEAFRVADHANARCAFVNDTPASEDVIDGTCRVVVKPVALIDSPPDKA